jgi:hypothetical protein
MNTKIELKSALAGMALGVLAMLAVGAAAPSNPVARYQIAGGAGSFAILDTASGQAWGANLVALQGPQPGFWEPKLEK